MKVLKRLIGAVLAAVSCVCVAVLTSGCGKTEGTVKVGILQVATHTALDNAREGFEETLTKWAEENGKKIEFDRQNANGDSNNEKTMASSLVSKNCDLLLGIATSSARALANATTKIPTLFTAVTDPETGHISGDNVTGTSDMAPIAQQIDLIKDIVPDCKKIGFVYCSGEENSQKQIDLAKEECDKIGLAYEMFTASASNDIATALGKINPDEIDAVYIPTDNLFAANMSLACGVLTPKGIPVIAGEEGQCEDGEALATLGVDYKKLGVQTAEIAIRILNGEKPSDIKFQYYNQSATFVINETNAKVLLEKNSALKIAEADIADLKAKFAK